jgi:hypothetical protein
MHGGSEQGGGDDRHPHEQLERRHEELERTTAL